jgi:hypothetical protein
VRVCVAPPTPWSPTARQLLALAQDTPFRMSKAPLGLGLDGCFQVLPFHDSTSVRIPEEVSREPAAVQIVVLTQDTPLSEL